MSALAADRAQGEQAALAHPTATELAGLSSGEAGSHIRTDHELC
jgi:hypothetical protein